jgi:hypothetical protein
MGHRVVKFKVRRGGWESRNILRRMSQSDTPSRWRPPPL